MIDRWESRPNHGETKLCKPTACAMCGNWIDGPSYLVRQVQYANMTAPAFYYYCEGCEGRQRLINTLEGAKRGLANGETGSCADALIKLRDLLTSVLGDTAP